MQLIVRVRSHILRTLKAVHTSIVCILSVTALVYSGAWLLTYSAGNGCQWNTLSGRISRKASPGVQIVLQGSVPEADRFQHNAVYRRSLVYPDMEKLATTPASPPRIRGTFKRTLGWHLNVVRRTGDEVLLQGRASLHH